MFPVLFHVGSFEFKTFSLAFLIAALVGLSWATKRAERLGIDPEKFGNTAIAMILFGALGARVVFILQEWPYYSHHLNEVFSWRFEGLTSFGGPLFAIPVAWYGAKKQGIPLRTYLDAAAAPMMLGHAIGRIGCFFNGCCYGAICPTGSPFGVHMDGANRYPVQLGDTAMNVVGVLALLALEKRGLRPGQSASLFLVFHGLARFIYEFGRAGVSSTYMQVGGHTLPLTDAHVVALGMMLVGSVAFVLLRKPVKVSVSAQPSLEA